MNRSRIHFRNLVYASFLNIRAGTPDKVIISKYKEKNQEIKQQYFNDQVIKYVMPIYKTFRSRTRRINVHAMDAKEAKTTRVITLL